MTKCRFTSTLMIILAFGRQASAQSDEGDIDPQQAAKAAATLDAVGADVQKLGDWSDQARLFESILDHVWSSSRWNSESDQFARRMAREVTRIPPWQYTDRINKVADLMAERYTMDEKRKTRFQSRLMREVSGLMIANAEHIVGPAMDYVRMQKNREPITPEIMAKWTKQTEPLLADGLFRIERIADDLRGDMSESQRQTFERDYESFDHRLADHLARREQWAAGKWSPQEWGLDQNPQFLPIKPGESIPSAPRVEQPAAMLGTEGAPTARPATAPDRQAVLSEDESTWARYVREFKKTHQLDPGQSTAIDSILGELESRARQYREAHLEALNAIAASDRSTAPAFAPIRTMFEELKSRAEALLTETQRTAPKP